VAADEAVLNKVHTKKLEKIPMFNFSSFATTLPTKWQNKIFLLASLVYTPRENEFEEHNLDSLSNLSRMVFYD
jgi:hypothetical protein